MLIRNPIKNKKGDLPTVLLVFLVFLVVLTSLFTFLIKSKNINEYTESVGLINEVYEEQNLAEFYIIEAVKTSIVESYLDITKDGGFVENPNFDLQTNVFFDELNSNLNGDFLKEFDKSIKRNFGNYDFQEDYLKKLKETILADRFDSSFNGEKLRINVKDLKLKKFSEKINVTYSPNISLEASLDKMGLHSFDQIYQAKEICKTKTTTDSLKECFQDHLKYFDVGVIERQNIQNQGQKSFIITLKSKTDFLIEGKFHTITLNFIPI